MLLNSLIMECIVAMALLFTAYEIGLECRKSHRKEVGFGTVLAFVGTGISYLIGVWIAPYILPQEVKPLWSAISAALAATDPIAVTILMTALAKRSILARRMGIVLETESLFNDPIGLFIFLLALGDASRALEGLQQALILACIIVAGSFIAQRFGGRKTAVIVRVSLTVACMFYGSQHHAALITLSVVANFLCGLIEAPYHTESIAIIDRTLLFSNFAGLVLTVGAAAIILLPAALAYVPVALIGAGFIILVRVGARTIIVGLLNQVWRAGSVGGAVAVGVISIATAQFLEMNQPMAAAILAGAAIGSVLFFTPWTTIEFNKLAARSGSLTT